MVALGGNWAMGQTPAAFAQMITHPGCEWGNRLRQPLSEGTLPGLPCHIRIPSGEERRACRGWHDQVSKWFCLGVYKILCSDFIELHECSKCVSRWVPLSSLRGAVRVALTGQLRTVVEPIREVSILSFLTDPWAIKASHVMVMQVTVTAYVMWSMAMLLIKDPSVCSVWHFAHGCKWIP